MPSISYNVPRRIGETGQAVFEVAAGMAAILQVVRAVLPGRERVAPPSLIRWARAWSLDILHAADFVPPFVVHFVPVRFDKVRDKVPGKGRSGFIDAKCPNFSPSLIRWEKAGVRAFALPKPCLCN